MEAQGEETGTSHPTDPTKVTFDTGAHDACDRFESARAFFDGVCELGRVGADTGHYHVCNESWRVGDFVANRASHGPTYISVTNKALDDAFCVIRFFARGRYVNIDDQTVRTLDGRSIVSGANIDGLTSEGFRFYSLEAPRDMVDMGTLHDGAFRATRLDTPHGRVLHETMASVFTALDADASAPKEATAETIAGLFALLAHGPDGACENARALYVLNRKQAMGRYINAHLDDLDLDAQCLAGIFGVSRAVLFRAFEEAGGVAETITARRMARAFHRLSRAVPRRGLVSATAVAAGYSDQAHFSRVFRRHIGAAPSDVVGLTHQRTQESKRRPLATGAIIEAPLAQVYR